MDIWIISTGSSFQDIQGQSSNDIRLASNVMSSFNSWKSKLMGIDESVLTECTQRRDHLSSVYECQTFFWPQLQWLEVILLQNQVSRLPSGHWTPHFTFSEKSQSQMSQRAQISGTANSSLLRNKGHTESCRTYNEWEKGSLCLPLNAAIIFLMLGSEIPLWPLAKMLMRSARSIRARFGASGSPYPVAWERIRFNWSCLIFSCGIKTSEKVPNPVVTP